MRLNPDCIRDILLQVEEISDISEFLIFGDDEIANLFHGYPDNVVRYHLRQCDLCGFFYDSNCTDDGTWIIADLSPAGHEFLANIREKNVWNGVKSIAGKIGSTSLDALVQIASNVVTELIKAQFGLSGPTA